MVVFSPWSCEQQTAALFLNHVSLFYAKATVATVYLKFISLPCKLLVLNSYGLSTQELSFNFAADSCQKLACSLFFIWSEVQEIRLSEKRYTCVYVHICFLAKVLMIKKSVSDSRKVFCYISPFTQKYTVSFVFDLQLPGTSNRNKLWWQDYLKSTSNCMEKHQETLRWDCLRLGEISWLLLRRIKCCKGWKLGGPHHWRANRGDGYLRTNMLHLCNWVKGFLLVFAREMKSLLFPEPHFPFFDRVMTVYHPS